MKQKLIQIQNFKPFLWQNFYLKLKTPNKNEQLKRFKKFLISSLKYILEI